LIQSVPLTEEASLTAPRICERVTVDSETHLAGAVNPNTSNRLVGSHTVEIGSGFAAHGAGILAVSTNRNVLDTCTRDSRDLVEVDVGLLVTPRAHKDVTNLHFRPGSSNLGGQVFVDVKRPVMSFGRHTERTITRCLPNTALGSGRNTFVAVCHLHVSVEGDEVVTTNRCVIHYENEYRLDCAVFNHFLEKSFYLTFDTNQHAA